MINKTKVINVGGIKIGANRQFVLIAGPCVIENKTMAMDHAKKLKDITFKLKIDLIFKASYDKANRTSIDSFRGLGIDAGLDILFKIKQDLKIPVLSDVHSVEDIEKAKEVLDVLQIPAFLCRQTDLLVAAAKTKKVVNVKKGQFLAPWDVIQIIKKLEDSGNSNILITERGVSFGYNNLVSDFRSIEIIREFGYPVVFDATHSVQQPGGLGKVSGGNSKFVPLLGRCAIAAGCDAIFIEVHKDPKKALSDGPNMLVLKDVAVFIETLKEIDSIVKGK